MDDAGSIPEGLLTEADLERLALDRISRAAAQAAAEAVRRARKDSRPPATARYWLDEYLSASAGGVSPSVLFGAGMPAAVMAGVIDGGSDKD
jgi:hypothetical protein